MCNQAVHDNASALEFVPDQCKIQEICIKAVDVFPNTLEFVHDQYMTQEMCDKAVCENLFYVKILSW